jgi:hypothetical protein
MRLSIFYATGLAQGPMVSTMLPIVAESARRGVRLRQSEPRGFSRSAAPSLRGVVLRKGASGG